jgi:hypothetical protein
MAKNDFECRYELEDGYVGKSRPQTFYILESDLEDGMTDADLDNLFHEMAEEHRNREIGIAEQNVSEFKAWAREMLSARE